MGEGGSLAAPVHWGYRLELPAWLAAGILAVTLAGCWALVYTTGGTRNVVPHVFYVPILLAAVPFGLSGGVVVAILATVLCGPAMPLNVATGEPQEAVSWLARGGFFVMMGVLSGGATSASRRVFETQLAERLRTEIQLANRTESGPADATWAIAVQRALACSTFRPVFQPIYTLDGARLIAVEALTRFDGDPPHPPDVWFAEAHKAGLGIELELATLEAALEASNDLDTAVALSFNASPLLLTDPRLSPLLDRHTGRRLIAEITEHAIIDDYLEVSVAVARLRSRGVRIAVDDAGAGFASLRHIVRLQPDLIKLDPSLTQDLGSDPVRTPLADALIQFAGRTGSQIIVEGIETQPDLHTWHHLGAHAAQGYLLARPGPLPFPMSHGTRMGPRHAARRHTSSGAGPSDPLPTPPGPRSSTDRHDDSRENA